MPPRGGRGKGPIKTKTIPTGAVRQARAPATKKSSTEKTVPNNPSQRQSRARTHLAAPDEDSEEHDDGDLFIDNKSDAIPGQPRPVPNDVILKRFCLFCWDQHGIRVHHSIPSAADVRELEKDLRIVQHKLRDAESKCESNTQGVTQHIQESQTNLTGGPVGRPQSENVENVKEISARYNALSYRFERAEELHKKGFGTSLDLWIDHLTITQITRDGWAYSALRQKLPEEWIQDTEMPEFLQDKRPRFPRGTYQPGDIENEAAALSDEEWLDDLDDYDQRAAIDMHRLRNKSPLPALVDDQDYTGGADNLSRDAAMAAINKIRKDQVPQIVRMWHDSAKPFTHRDSKLQMKDYIKDVHTFMEPRSDHKPSLEAYRAITNIAFSMYAAHRLWKKHGLTDEGYSKVTRDAFQQLGDLRSSLDEAGVKGLPPLLDLPPRRKHRQREPLEPFVIDHWMDSKEAQTKQVYTYKPDRPLGPMISETTHASHAAGSKGYSVGGIATTENRFVEKERYSGRSSQVKISREELIGLSMEIDQLVDGN